MNSPILPKIESHPFREILKSAGFSIYQVAKYLGINHSRTWTILSGRGKPTLGQQEKLQSLVNQIEAESSRMMKS